MRELAIDVRGLRKSFGSTRALDDVDLHVERGGVFGLLGPNGAGKTTTVRILTGVLHADAAERMRVLGGELPGRISDVRPRVGVQTDTVLYERLTAHDNLVYFGRLYGMTRSQASRVADALLERFGLGERAKEKVGGYSKGMKQKVLIARALVADPELVYLDEPTAGLDPEAAHELMTYIRDVSRDDGRTFFITSHRLEEMESVCTRVGVLARGTIVAQGSPADVARAIVPEVRVRVTALDPAALDPAVVAGVEGVCSAKADARGGVTAVLDDRAAIPAVVRRVAALPLDLLGVAEAPPTLEEAYLRLVHDADASASGGDGS